MDEFNILEKLPVWKDKYEKLGVSARELYMRQNGLCWLVTEEDGEVYCTDGKDKAPTCSMLNPTIECVQCIVNFAKKSLANG
jgi:hypothetical protein